MGCKLSQELQQVFAMCGFVLRKLNCQNVLLKLLLDVLDFSYSSLIAYLVLRLDCTIWWFNKMLSVTMDNIGKFFPPRAVAKEILHYFTRFLQIEIS